MLGEISRWKIRYSREVQLLMDLEQVEGLAENELQKIEKMEMQFPVHQSRKRGVQIDPETDQNTPFEIWITTEPKVKRMFVATKEEMEAISDRLPKTSWQQASKFEMADEEWQQVRSHCTMMEQKRLSKEIKVDMETVRSPPFSMN